MGRAAGLETLLTLTGDLRLIKRASLETFVAVTAAGKGMGHGRQQNSDKNADKEFLARTAFVMVVGIAT